MTMIVTNALYKEASGSDVKYHRRSFRKVVCIYLIPRFLLTRRSCEDPE